MYNEKPNLSFVKLFACVAFMHIEKPFRKKLDQTSKIGIFLGISDYSKCYLIGFEDEKGELKVWKSRNVRFVENEFYFEEKKTQKLVEDIDNDSNEVSFLSQRAIDPLLPKMSMRLCKIQIGLKQWKMRTTLWLKTMFSP